MKTSRKVAKEPETQAPPALTPAGREARMVAYAMDLAEEQLRNGTASSQVITHFLKLGTESAKLELERLKNETELIKAKKESLESQRMLEGLYADAIKAFAIYTGHDEDESDDYDSDFY